MKSKIIVLIFIIISLSIAIPSSTNGTQSASPVSYPHNLRTTAVTQPISGSNPQLSGISVTLTKVSYQQISGGCYNAQISLNITSSLSFTFRVFMFNFYLFEAGQNLTIQNDINYARVNNTFSEVVLFPSTPIILVLMFQSFCLQPATIGTRIIYVAYDDGIRFYKTQVVPLSGFF